MAFSLTYNDYVQSHPGDASGGSEGGQGTSSLLSEDQWNNMSDADKWTQIGDGLVLAPNDPRYKPIADQLGLKGSDGLDNYLVIGPGKASDVGKTGNVVDPSRVIDVGGGVLATNHANLSPAAEFSGGGWADWMWPVMFLAAAAGGAALSGGAAAGGATAAGGSAALQTGGILTGADVSAGTSGLGYVGGVSGAAGGTAGAAAGATAPTAGGEPPPEQMGPPSNLAPDPAPPAPGTPPGADMEPPLDTTPSGTPGPHEIAGTGPETLPTGSASGATIDPVTGDVVPAGTTPATSGNGIIDGARSTATNAANWYNRLSPASRFVIGTAVSQGARGAFTAIAQHNANQAAIDAENRHRADVIRQGQVPVLPPNTFVPKNPGG